MRAADWLKVMTNKTIFTVNEIDSLRKNKSIRKPNKHT